MHVRLLVLALEAEQWATVVANVVQLLRSDGVIQWEEYDIRIERALQGAPDSSTAAMDALMRLSMSTAVPKFVQGVFILEARLKEAGLRVRDHAMSIDRVPDTRRAWTEISLLGTANLLKKLVLTDPEKVRVGSAELEEMIARCQDDMSSGAYYRYDLHVYVGVKNG